LVTLPSRGHLVFVGVMLAIAGAVTAGCVGRCSLGPERKDPSARDPGPQAAAGVPFAEMPPGARTALDGWRLDDGSGEQGPFTSESLLAVAESVARRDRLGPLRALRVLYHAGTGRERYQVIRPVTVENIEAARICYACADWIFLITE